MDLAIIEVISGTVVAETGLERHLLGAPVS